MYAKSVIASREHSRFTLASSFIRTDKKKLLMKVFINSQFKYCYFIWMFHRRTFNNRIDRIHESALSVFYNNKISIFNELLQKNKSVIIYQRNLQVIATIGHN